MHWLAAGVGSQCPRARPLVAHMLEPQRVASPPTWCFPMRFECPLQEVALAALPPSVAASLHRLEVTPRPGAMCCQLEVQLPAGARLASLTVNGSFHSVLSSAAAPQVFIDTAALAQ